MDLRSPEFDRPDAHDGRATLALIALATLLLGLLGILGIPTAAGSSEPAADTCEAGAEGDAVDLPSGDTETFCYVDEAPTTTAPAPPTTEPAPTTTEPSPTTTEAEPDGGVTADEETEAAPPGSLASTGLPRAGPEGNGNSIAMTKTVGTDITTCATTDVVTVPAGSEVYYCYSVTNTGSVTLSRHDLVDDQLGTLLTNFPFTLGPGASAFLTEAATLNDSTVNTATWTAYNPGPTNTVSDTDTASVVVVPSSITLDKTVGTDPAVCATTEAVTVTAGSEVTYCYEVTNTGPVTLTNHDLEDSELGTLLNDFPFTLPPASSAFLTQTTTITETTVNLATWTAFNPGPSNTASATDSATVVVPPAGPSISLEKTVGTDPDLCATTDVVTVAAGSQVTYCYEVTNTGGVTFTNHDLVDDQLGTLLNDFPFTLGPGATTFLTQSTTLTESTVNTATWTARAEPLITITAEGLPISASDTDTAEVVVIPPSISLEKTVGLDPGACATTDAITVTSGTEVVYCYEVTNTGPVTFDTHDLVDDQLGALLTGFSQTLGPGDTFFVTEAASIADTTVNTATWTASVGPPPVSPPAEGTFLQAQAADSATVNVEDEPPPPTTVPPTTAPPTVDPDVVDPEPTGTLARTGSELNGWFAAGALLLALGVGFELVSRRRRSA